VSSRRYAGKKEFSTYTQALLLTTIKYKEKEHILYNFLKLARIKKALPNDRAFEEI